MRLAWLEGKYIYIHDSDTLAGKLYYECVWCGERVEKWEEFEKHYLKHKDKLLWKEYM